MKIDNLSRYTKGWIVGDFAKSLVQNKDVEVAIKRYRAGDEEPSHTHKLAVEHTIVIDGIIAMNGKHYFRTDIITVEPGEFVEFKAISDAITCCIKTPSLPGDKYFE